MTEQPPTADPTADDVDKVSTSLVPIPAAPNVAVVAFRGKPGSPQMVDPEGKIRSGQFRGNSRIARHTAHRPYERD